MAQHADSPSGPATPAPVVHEEGAVRDLLYRYARALNTGDGRAAAALWSTPALLIGDQEVRVLSGPEEAARLFAAAREQYAERGIVDIRPEILRLEWITDWIALCEVRWPYIDALGNEMGAESATYTLRRDPDRELKIRVALLHGPTTRH